MAEPAESLNSQRSYEAGNRYWYEFDNTATWLAEVLDGSMRTTFDLQYDGNEIYSDTGTKLRSVFENSVEAAEELVASSPNLLFELRRRNIEHQEYDEMRAMANGERPNTMVVVSDFPPELADATEDVGGYNVSRKQTMLRVVTCQPDGTLTMTSQSLDLSDRTALEAVYAHYGLTPEPGELLGQRIFVETPAQEQAYVVDYLTGVYDRALATHYGGTWYAGRRDESVRNTFDFARQQTDLIDYFVQKRLYSPGEAESMRYNLAAAVVERHRKQIIGSAALAGAGYDKLSTGDLELELHHAGNQARSEGKDYSGCGLSVKADEESTQQQMEAMGYGNKTDAETVYKFDKKQFCLVCQPQPAKKTQRPKWCGPCGICRTCDSSLRKAA